MSVNGIVPLFGTKNTQWDIGSARTFVYAALNWM